MPLSLSALGAARHHLPGGRGAAAADGIECLQVSGQETIGVLRLERRAVILDQGGQLHGYTFFRSTCSAPTRRLRVSVVLCSVESVRWA